MKKLQVLVVGAGPTGLAAASALSKLGICARIVDKNSSRSDKSKALGVQAGTLTCIEHGLDPRLSEEMIATGRPVQEAWIHLEDAGPIKVSLKSIPGKFNFILILEQSETERFLETHLNRQSLSVERNTELMFLEDHGTHVVSKVKHASGEIEEVVSDYVIGCDGAHSTVRHAAQIAFEGGSYAGDFLLGDVELEWSWPYDSVQTFVNGRGLIAAFPFRGNRKYRLILVPKDIPPQSETLSLELDEFRSILSAMSRNTIQVRSASWLTRFRIHHRMAEHFRKGRIFLAGDAGHIHSPVGGQGMNTGIQDALNLAYKLKRVYAGQSEVLLDDYERERLPVARNVLRSTDFVFRMGLLPETAISPLLRRHALPLLIGSRWVQSRVAASISEMAIAKKEIAGYV